MTGVEIYVPGPICFGGAAELLVEIRVRRRCRQGREYEKWRYGSCECGHEFYRS
jgi:hypothetical protein